MADHHGVDAAPLAEVDLEASMVEAYAAQGPAEAMADHDEIESVDADRVEFEGPVPVAVLPVPANFPLSQLEP
jgi:hypothetical protein